MQYLSASKHFQKQLKRLHNHKRQKVVKKLKEFLAILTEGSIPKGYGFKKINGDKYEIRVDIKLRIVMKSEGDTLVCHVVGDHDEVKRYLRGYRNK